MSHHVLSFKFTREREDSSLPYRRTSFWEFVTAFPESFPRELRESFGTMNNKKRKKEKLGKWKIKERNFSVPKNLHSLCVALFIALGDVNFKLVRTKLDDAGLLSKHIQFCLFPTGQPLDRLSVRFPSN